MSSQNAVLRIERGQADAAELAALTAVLLALLGARGEAAGGAADRGAGGGPDGAGSSWWRRPGEFVPPGSWAGGASSGS
ncbi:acyl-CoA carboxylase epsilon subunit [Streptomyces sp. NPDC002685]|uniref:acyl-CoA carboxylase epsilon subunit n=1 Tax=Streptomyces sp. NPDC002685 TaxID=3154540 RepID=UPI00332AAF95